MLPRKLSHLDTQKIINHLVSLQGEDRRLRFGGTVSDEYIKQYVTKSFDLECKWFGVDHIDGMLVAVCHAAINNGEAELGCSVDPDYRNQGFAQAMFNRAVTWIRTRGVTQVYMHCLLENKAMRHIANKNDMTVQSDYGEVDAKVGVEPATPMTSMQDAMYDRMSLYDMIVKNNINTFNRYWSTEH